LLNHLARGRDVELPHQSPNDRPCETLRGITAKMRRPSAFAVARIASYSAALLLDQLAR
jgi:hypothetical protein